MGNSQPKLQNKGKEQIIKEYFDEDELSMLGKTWQDMADRHDGKGVAKQTFLDWIGLPGIFGERMFQMLDVGQNEALNYDEFICGVGTACRGNRDEKIDFLFD
jgi:hypothetical protein